MHCDGAIRNIEKEISRECANRGIQIHENFLNYYLKLLSLDPSWGIADKDVVNRMDVQRFIKHVVTQVEDLTSPSMIVLRMQFYFLCNFQHKSKMVKRNRTELLARLKNLENDIVDTKKLTDDEDIDWMYRRLVYYITLASGLGNPTVDSVYKEVRAALGSILDRHEVKEFVAQPRYIKIENLMEFTKLVTGIRLFNKDCGKGGEGMEDLTKLINEALGATASDLQNTLVNIMDKVNLITTALDFVYFTECDERSHFIVVTRPPKGITLADVDFVKDSLIVYRQYELFIRKLIDEIEKIETITSQIFTTLQRGLIDLHRVVKHRIAIPVNQVFPHFIKLSDIWWSLQDQALLLAKINQIMVSLQKYCKILAFPDAIAEAMIPPNEAPITDAQRIERTSGQTIPNQRGKVTVLDPSHFHDLGKTKLEYLGFCAWKIFMTEGALIPGNPGLGVVATMNMRFVFSSVEAGRAFGSAPEKCVMETIKLARRKPELINLLNIQNRLILVRNIKELFKEPPVLPLTEDVEVQTETHARQINTDKNYFSNIWDFKRRAILLANMSHCKTVACQTGKSYYVTSVRSMTYGQKEKDTQTKRDNYSNVPKPSNFIFGLRGRKDDTQFVVDLTRPVDE